MGKKSSPGTVTTFLPGQSLEIKEDLLPAQDFLEIW
jgi:hypothetical protein